MTVFLTQMAVIKPKLPLVLPKMTLHWTQMNAKVRLVIIKALIRPWKLKLLGASKSLTYLKTSMGGISKRINV